MQIKQLIEQWEIRNEFLIAKNEKGIEPIQYFLYLLNLKTKLDNYDNNSSK